MSADFERFYRLRTRARTRREVIFQVPCLQIPANKRLDGFYVFIGRSKSGVLLDSRFIARKNHIDMIISLFTESHRAEVAPKMALLSLNPAVNYLQFVTDPCKRPIPCDLCSSMGFRTLRYCVQPWATSAPLDPCLILSRHHIVNKTSYLMFLVQRQILSRRNVGTENRCWIIHFDVFFFFFSFDTRKENK